MLRRTILATFAALALSLPLRAQEILEGPGPYVPMDPDITDVSAMIGEGLLEEALAELDSLMAADSLDDALWYYRGMCLLDLQRFPEATECLERAVAMDPENSSYYELLYSAYSFQGLESQADSLHLAMAKIFPRKYRTPYILTKLAEQAWLESRDDTLALRYFEEALAAEEGYPPALYGKAEICRGMGNYPAYFATVEELVRSGGLHAETKTSYLDRVVDRLDGPTYRVWHNQLDAIMDALAETHPTDSCSLVCAGRWFYSTDQKEKGIAYFHQWRDTNPTNYNATSLCITIVMNEGTDKDVIAACDEALTRFKRPEHRVILLCTKADCLYKIGRKNKAFCTYEKALKADPDNMMVLNNYAYFLSLEKRNLAKAEKMSRRTVEAEPDNVNSLDTYGYILYLLKRPAEAKVWFKRAIIYGGKENEAVLYHYYLVLEALGEKDLALYYKSLYEAKTKKK
ncbi:MAG: tetratricopeptide repeat protein [Bacteroidales bacterium]|nr:tetratricopeptide repeat protein [Bacteroidales bacterium]